MSSRYSAARPKRAGENFARTHHHDNEDEDSKRVKFDVRNPSILAPEAPEEDNVLDADVIGGSHATKRGAVNLDGYDSDSDNDTFNKRAESRKKRDVNILDQMDNYSANNTDGPKVNPNNDKTDDDDDDDDDMFGGGGDDDDDENTKENQNQDEPKNQKKTVQFLDVDQIDGQEESSKSGGAVRLTNDESSDDESDKELAIEEEGIDEEVGAGGLKRNAPKLEAFHLKDEMEHGQFDDAGNYVRRAGDPDAVHDTWMTGLSKKDMKKAAEAHEKREAEARKQRMEDDIISTGDLLKSLILQLERGETPLEALARLGKQQPKTKKIPAWKLKKMNKSTDGMEVDSSASNEQDAAAAKVRASINAITESADKLLSRDYEEIYDDQRELLTRAYRRETGEAWVEPARPVEKDDDTDDRTGIVSADTKWQFRWTDGRDDALQGPFDGPTMKSWLDAGYFKEGVEFRQADGEGAWTTAITFE